jgi:hypothetical protein
MAKNFFAMWQDGLDINKLAQSMQELVKMLLNKPDIVKQSPYTRHGVVASQTAYIDGLIDRETAKEQRRATRQW